MGTLTCYPFRLFRSCGQPLQRIDQEQCQACKTVTDKTGGFCKTLLFILLFRNTELRSDMAVAAQHKYRHFKPFWKQLNVLYTFYHVLLQSYLFYLLISSVSCYMSLVFHMRLSCRPHSCWEILEKININILILYMQQQYTTDATCYLLNTKWLPSLLLITTWFVFSLLTVYRKKGILFVSSRHWYHIHPHTTNYIHSKCQSHGNKGNRSARQISGQIRVANRCYVYSTCACVCIVLSFRPAIKACWNITRGVQQTAH